jgi:hypothetical protein
MGPIRQLAEKEPACRGGKGEGEKGRKGDIIYLVLKTQNTNAKRETYITNLKGTSFLRL